jgi:hypothetical protein
MTERKKLKQENQENATGSRELPPRTTQERREHPFFPLHSENDQLFVCVRARTKLATFCEKGKKTVTKGVCY